MKKIADQKKLECLIEHLTESHLDTFGGYPYDYEWIGDILIVASLDDGKERARTQIETYKRQDLLDWYDRAAAMNPKEPMEAIWETQKR